MKIQQPLKSEYTSRIFLACYIPLISQKKFYTGPELWAAKIKKLVGQWAVVEYYLGFPENNLDSLLIHLFALKGIKYFCKEGL